MMANNCNINLSYLDTGMKELYRIWDEIGFEEMALRDRCRSVESHFNGLMDRMVREDGGLKKRLVKSLKYSVKHCMKLSRELDMSYEEPESNKTLIEMELLIRKKL